MAGVSTKLILNPVELERMLKSKDGPVGRSLVRKATRVVSGAKRRCPVDSGRLRQSIRYEIGKDGKGLFARCGTDVEYAAAVHDGHGEITPTNASILHFFTKDGTEVFTMRVGPTTGVPFLKDALNDIRGM